MGFSNSSLVTYKRISSNKTSPRKGKIDTITIHCYVGQVTAKQGCDYFATTSREVSANYVVGYDGSVGLSVDEKDRAWTSGGVDKNGNPIKVNGISGRDNDHRAVTIEVACETTHPYKITDAAYKSLINLVADICKRNNIKELKWKNDKSLVGKVNKQNMTVHRWFSATACPGQYLLDKHSDIAKKVNAKLNPKPAKKTNVLYRVQVGAFSKQANANAQLSKIKKAGFEGVLVKVGKLYKIQVGAYSSNSNAQTLVKKLKAKGFEAFITTEAGSAVTTTTTATTTTLKKGDKVKVQKNAPQYGKTSKFQSWVYSSTLYVREVDGNRVVVSTQKTGDITGAVDKKYLTKI